MKFTSITARGLQAHLARKIHISRSAISEIFAGKHQPSKQTAAKLEAEFIRLGIPVTRWDLLYERPEGQSLADYLKSKRNAEKG